MKVDLLHSPDLSSFSLWTLVDREDGEVDSIDISLPPEAVEVCREFLRRVQWAEMTPKNESEHGEVQSPFAAGAVCQDRDGRPQP